MATDTHTDLPSRAGYGWLCNLPLGDLAAARRDLNLSLAFGIPGSPAQETTLRARDAVDAELARRANGDT